MFKPEDTTEIPPLISSSLKPPRENYKPPGESLFKLPGQTLLKFPGQTHLKSPGQTLLKSPGQTLLKSPGQTLLKSPGQTLLKLPIGSAPPAVASQNITPQQVQPVGQGGQWKAPWLNLDNKRNKRHTDHVFKPDGTCQSQSKPRDVASILKTKLDSNIVEETGATVGDMLSVLERGRRVTGM